MVISVIFPAIKLMEPSGCRQLGSILVFAYFVSLSLFLLLLKFFISFCLYQYFVSLWRFFEGSGDQINVRGQTEITSERSVERIGTLSTSRNTLPFLIDSTTFYWLFCYLTLNSAVFPSFLHFSYRIFFSLDFRVNLRSFYPHTYTVTVPFFPFYHFLNF